MGANSSNARFHDNICNTPPKTATRLLFDPRSPSDGISRTPIQIDSQVPVPPVKLYNHVMPYIAGPDIIFPDGNNENINHREQKLIPEETEPKRSSGVEPTLDPTKVLTALVENNNGQLPPYQL